MTDIENNQDKLRKMEYIHHRGRVEGLDVLSTLRNMMQTEHLTLSDAVDVLHDRMRKNEEEENGQYGGSF